jgi:hypothetical protein
MKKVSLFHNAREAKEFLVSRIVEQAQHERVPLTDVERKMLYFSETGWTLPDMGTASDEFNQVCDQGRYEEKIAGLVSGAYKRALHKRGDECDRWWSAILLLGKQDHYVVVMIRKAALRPRGDQLKLLGAAVGIVLFIVGVEILAMFVNTRYGIDLRNYWPSGRRPVSGGGQQQWSWPLQPRFCTMLPAANCLVAISVRSLDEWLELLMEELRELTASPCESRFRSCGTSLHPSTD